MSTDQHPGTTGRADTALLRVAAGARHRLHLSLVSLVYVLLAVPALALLILVSVSMSVAVVGVGLALLLLLVPLTSQLADVHRRLAGHVLGTTIERPYRSTSGESGLGVLRAWSGDGARWREYGWLWVRTTLSWATAWIALGLLLGVLWYLVFPLVWGLAPRGVFETNYGIVTTDTQAKAFLEWIFLVIAVWLWWVLTPPLVRFLAVMDRAMLGPGRDELEARVEQVSRSRAETVDHSAAEVRRIERDLHDGAQARLVALGMNLGLARELLETDPAAAARLLAEAQETTTTTLGDIRSVVRGIHPPVLADRGLVGAVQALALDLALPVSVLADVPGRPPLPVESAVYFAVAEGLANVTKHAGATRATVALAWADGVLTASVTDDGRGGADVTDGTGLAGVARRIEALDGTMGLDSPTGGPTVLTLEVPCASSSARTTHSSGTD